MLVGRMSQLVALEERLEAARGGRGGLVLLAGEAGIGKTRLAGELAERAVASGANAQWVRWRHLPGAPAYWAWLPALRSLLAESSDELLAAADPPALAQLAVILPSLYQRRPDLPPAESVEAQSARFLLQEAVVELLRAASASAPIVLVADDLHSADRESLLLLEFIAAELPSLPVLVMGTYREHEAAPHTLLGETLAALAHEPSVERVTLPALRLEDTVQVVCDASADALDHGLALSIAERSAGNPFFARELARATREHVEAEADLTALPMPATVRVAIGARLARLSAAARAALEWSAVLGGGIELEALHAVSGLGDSLPGALDEALSAQVLAEAGANGEYRFAHPLFAEVAYGSIGAGRRMTLHRHAAAELRALYGLDDEVHVEQIAYHLRLAAPLGEFDLAIEYLERAGSKLCRELAFERSADQYRGALELLDRARPFDNACRARLLLGLGEAEALPELGDGLEALRGAVEAAVPAGMADVAGLGAVLYAGRLMLRTSGWDVSSIPPIVERALQLQEAMTPALRVRAWAELAKAWTDLGEGNPDLLLEAADLAGHGLRLAREIDDPLTVGAAVAAMLTCSGGGRPSAGSVERLDEREALLEELLAAAEAAGDNALMQSALLGAARFAQDVGDISALDAALERLERHARKHRAPRFLFRAAMLRQWQDLLLGRFEQIEGHLTHGAAGGDPTFNAAILAALRVMKGPAVEVPHDAVNALASRPTSSGPAAAALLAIVQGRTEDARAIFEQLAADNFSSVEGGWGRLATIAVLAEVCVAFCDQERACQLAELLRPYRGRYCGGPILPGAGGASARHQGMLAALLGQHEEAAGYFEQALELNSRIGARPAIAATETEYAALLIERGRPPHRDRAESLLSSAAAIAGELGMQPLAERAGALQNRLRAAPRSAYPAALTRREVEVLRLIARGCNNDEIAEALVLSVRTVERHITNLYRKIDARGRADATAFALRHQLLPLDVSGAR